MPSVVLNSVQVGLPQTLGEYGAADPRDRPWTTGIYKSPVAGPVFADWQGLAGDGQADMRVHGGPDKAVLAYCAAHFPQWRSVAGMESLVAGGFGENFTLDGIVEEQVCIGDVWLVGAAKLQVSQPRQPCGKLARRWRLPDLPKRVIAAGATGWYFRVLHAGFVEAGQTLELLERPRPEWTIPRANQIMYARRPDGDLARALAETPELSDAWRDELQERLAG